MKIETELKAYEQAVTSEKWATVSYTQAKYEYDVKVAQLVAEAYANGNITGKNADERKRNETIFIAEKLGKERDALQRKYESQLSAKFTAELALQRVKTLRAWLYSKSAIQDL